MFFTLVVIGFIIQHLFPLNLMFHSWSGRLLVGMPIFIISGLNAGSALTVMRRSKTSVTFNCPTTKFITAGPFRYTRNPLYLSLLLLMVCVAVGANSGWHLLAAAILFRFLDFAVVRREEHYLEGIFGDEYRQYKGRVRRWL